MDKKKLFNITVSTALVISLSFNGYLGYKVYTLGEKLEVIQIENTSLVERIGILEGEKSDLTEKLEEHEAKKITLSEKIEQLEINTYIARPSADGSGILEGTSQSSQISQISQDGLLTYNPILTPEEQTPTAPSGGTGTVTPPSAPQKPPQQQPQAPATPPSQNNNTTKPGAAEAWLESIGGRGACGFPEGTVDGNGQDLSSADGLGSGGYR